MAVKLNSADLQFILRQIKIAEANTAGTPLTEIYVDAAGNVVQPIFDADGNVVSPADAVLAIPEPLVPNGLRTVDGTYNNLVAGRETWGAADQPMPRLLDGSFLNDADGDVMPFGPPGETTPVVTNTDYSISGGPTGTPLINGGHGGNVADADPRIISNLVVDMSVNNPAAVEVWFANEAALAAFHARYGEAAIPVRPGEGTNGNFIEIDNTDLASIPNISPDEGISKPFNSWMTFFGQFFDHGLDLISKGGNGSVYIPLAADDPLVTHGPDGIAGSGDEVPPERAFMVLTRSTPVDGQGADGILGTADDTAHEGRNTTTPFVDQNQTYTSHASHQVFLREYKLDGEGRPLATGHLLDGTNNSLPTWADIKAQARVMLGIELTDQDVLNLPLLRTDAYGEFVRDPLTGFAQVVTGLGEDGIPNTADDITVSGTPDAPVNSFDVLAIRTGHAFLDDIAHGANPGGKTADDDMALGLSDTASTVGKYDNELLDRHFITGDGRGNENIGLTAVHHIFHSEHNRQVEMQKLTILQSADLGFINDWLTSDIGGLPAGFATLDTAGQQAYADSLSWDGERLFQAGRFATEMQYQHLVFEEFARKIHPNIDPFVFNAVTDINPAIFAEFANTVYRFGHSMLTDSMPRIFADGTSDDVGLITSFLNPVLFDNNGAMSADEAAGAIVRGMTVERGNEIDEFIVSSLRNNLVGLPLDLAALNIARGRDTGVPSINDARAQLFAQTGSTFLKPYANWVELAGQMSNPVSVVNLIAAYGLHSTVVSATTLDQKRDAAMAIVFGGTFGEFTAPSDRVAFLTGTGAWSAESSGLNDIDLWVGGLAERNMPFGGMLGSTFTAIFEAQMEALQFGDRFYYLSRTQGQNFLVELENNSFTKLIMANTDLAQPGADGIRGTDDDVVNRHIGTDSFAVYDYVLEVKIENQDGADPVGDDPVLEAIGLGKVLRDNPNTEGPDSNYLKFTGGEHVVLGGTSDNDTLIGADGDDGIWGDAGNDVIEAGFGVDLVNGGAGDDIITDMGDEGDFLKGDDGNDVMSTSSGLDILMGGRGKDVIFLGADSSEIFGGEGDDFIMGSVGADFLLGNEGNDWMEAGDGFDTTAGDNSELFFNSAVKGHDVMFAGSEEHDFDAESGDDIMVQGESVMRSEGMFGFDWSIYKGVGFGADADLRVPIFTTEQADILRNRFDKTEALSGWEFDDILRGDNRVLGAPDAAVGVAGAEGVFFNDGLDAEGLARISGLSDILSITAANGFWEEGNVLLGGGGSDLLQGNGGNDVLDGDRWLNVRISIKDGATEIATVDTLKHVFSVADEVDASWVGKSLFELLTSRTIRPDQMSIQRELLNGGPSGEIDVALFNDAQANYTVTDSGNGVWTVAHTGFGTDPAVLIDDAIDTLHNVEVLRFANGTERVIGQIAATGLPVISDITPEDGQLLSVVTTGIADRNGLPAVLSFQWQESDDGGLTWAAINGATGESFTVQHAQENALLRAVVSFTDNGGFAESLVSAATAPVMPLNLAPTGAPVISDTTPSTGQVLTADTGGIADHDGLGTFIYQWEMSGDGGTTWVPVAGAATVSLAVGNDLIDDTLRLMVSYTDGGGAAETVTSAATAAVGDSNLPTLGAPVISDTTPTETQALSVNLAGITDGNGIATTTVLWQTSTNGGTTFTTVGTAASFTPTQAHVGSQIRVAATVTDLLGNMSVVTSPLTAVVGDVATAGVGSGNGTAGADILTGNVLGTTINGLAGDDTITGGLGNDTINAGDGDDMIIWNANNVLTDGSDFVDGGAGIDTIDVNTRNGVNEIYRIYTRIEASTVGIAITNANTEIVITRSQTLFGVTTFTKILELDNIEEIVIGTNNATGAPGGAPGQFPNAGAAGQGDTVQIFGDFRQTSLLLNTITINGTSANDVVDINGLDSAHRIVFRTAGGNDTIVGSLRPQDVIELPAGASLADFTVATGENGVSTLSGNGKTITFVAPNGMPTIAEKSVTDAETGDDAVVSGFTLSAADLAGLKALVTNQPVPGGDDDTEGMGGVRSLSGAGNNVDHPEFGAADQPFIRLTDARYGAPDANGNRAINPIFDGLDPRAISNTLGTQEAGLPTSAADANIFFMAFGQYFDHGLDFLPKSSANGMIEIGGPGMVRGPGSNNPADLTRAEVAMIDADGIPQHLNKTSPYVDQNQAYGSRELVGQFLRESDGDRGFGMRLLQGQPDPSNPAFNLIPTLREVILHHWQNDTIFVDASLPGGSASFRSYFTVPAGTTPGTRALVNDAGEIDAAMVAQLAGNFMGSGNALLLDTNPFIDLLDHRVAGDGRANENYALTAVHTVWARNHNFHVENLVDQGFEGTAEEIFQAAKMLNESDYQRVVFTDFADKLLGGMKGQGDHGWDGYNPDADARISHEFASSVYRVGHSLIGQTMTVLGADGIPMQVPLFDAFLNPTNEAGAFTGPLPAGYTPQPGYAQHGVSSILGGIVTQPAEEVDFNIVDAVRNDLVRINADLFAFNVARGWDVGIGTLNQVRADLKASTNPYVSEAASFAGNLNPYTSWEDFQIRNSLSEAVIAQFRTAYPDLVLTSAEDIAAFSAVNPDITLADGPNGSKIVKGIDRVDLWVGGLAETHINGGVVGQTFWVVLHEQLDRLQEGDRFYYLNRFENFDFYGTIGEDTTMANILARTTGLTTLDTSVFDSILDSEDGEDTGGGGTGEDTDGGDTDEDTGGGDTGGDDGDTGEDTGGGDTGEDDGDTDEDPDGSDDSDEDDSDTDEDTDGGDDSDEDSDGSSDNGDDAGPGQLPIAASGAILGGAAADALFGTENRDAILGLAGRDVIFGGAGNDDILGGAGADMVFGDAGNDRLLGESGNDFLDAGAGTDTVFGGDGDDVIVASAGDGDDVYYGDDMVGGTGSDIIDYSAIAAAIVADLGTGFGERGHVQSAQSGNDVIWSIETFLSGSGNDMITSGLAANVIDGGAGTDTFRFTSAEAADGDTILGFAPGDRIDLSGIDANGSQSGNGVFALVSGGFTGTGQLLISEQTREDGVYTVVEGNVSGDAAADFKIGIKGQHDLKTGDFEL